MSRGQLRSLRLERVIAMTDSPGAALARHRWSKTSVDERKATMNAVRAHRKPMDWSGRGAQKRVARKEYSCSVCNELIVAGEVYYWSRRKRACEGCAK